MATRAPARLATDSEVAKAMGFDKGAVSRVVNAQRRPGVAFMTAAERVLGWSLRAQHLALADGKYPERFRAQIKRWTPPPADAA